jgi:hypothetical protein
MIKIKTLRVTGGIENAELTSYAQNPPINGRRRVARSEKRIDFIWWLYGICEFCQKNLHFTNYIYSVYVNTQNNASPQNESPKNMTSHEGISKKINDILEIWSEMENKDKAITISAVLAQWLFLTTVVLGIYKWIGG